MKTKHILIFLFVFCTFTIYSQNKPFVVVLDAGHGGKDPGNKGNGFIEKDIALNIVLEAGKVLEKNKNIKVIYTRKTDVFIGLSERAAIANNADADLFVSVHCNGAKNAAAYGTETFVLGLHKSEENFEVAKKENQVIFLEDNHEEIYAGFNPNSPESLIGLIIQQEEYLVQSIELASYVQNNFTQQLQRKDRSVKQAGFWVLLRTSMPSVLIEVGFLTNLNEGKYLNSKKGQSDMADAISKAILKYHSSVSSYSSFENSNSSNTSVQAAEDDEVEMEMAEAEIYKDVIFKVQLAASSKKLELKPYNFKGLDNLSSEKEGSLHKYYHGNTSDYSVIKNLLQQAKSKGYTTAFVVAFKNGKKVNLTEVLNSGKN